MPVRPGPCGNDPSGPGGKMYPELIFYDCYGSSYGGLLKHIKMFNVWKRWIIVVGCAKARKGVEAKQKKIKTTLKQR